MVRIEVCIASNPQITIKNADTRGAPLPRLLRGQTYQFHIALNINDPLFTDQRFPFSANTSNPRFLGVCSGDVYYGKRYDVAPFFAYDCTSLSTIVSTGPTFPYAVPALGGLIDDLDCVAVVIQIQVTIPADVPAGSYELTYANAELASSYPVPISLEIASETAGSPINLSEPCCAQFSIIGILAVAAGVSLLIYWYWNRRKRKHSEQRQTEQF